MNMISLKDDLKGNSYPGRGIIIGKTPEEAEEIKKKLMDAGASVEIK